MKVTDFDIAQSPLERGTTLVEAGAGTGKTHAISGVVIRLILEHQLTIPQILVVTFTEAATAELRDRIRCRLAKALELMEAGLEVEDPALSVFTTQADPAEREKGMQRLRLSLLSFDEAPVFTIHGFCQRMLREHALETGSFFDVELLTDTDLLVRECVEDFLRRHTLGTDPLSGTLMAWLREKEKLSAGNLTEWLHQFNRHPGMFITGDEDERETNPEQWKETAGKTLEKIQKAWLAQGEEVSALLRDDPRLSRAQKAFRSDVLEESLKAMEDFSGKGDFSPGILEKLLRLTSSRVAEGTKPAAKTIPEHPFFHLCQELEDVLRRGAALLRRAFFEEIRDDLARLKRERNILTFDDLLNRLADGLAGPGGEFLAASIRDRFGAALVDEFQDTDPVQWGIFKTLFADSGRVFFLIGDPKQAIYSFRGADLFTYLEARQTACHTHSLSKNWRSDPLLIEGINRLFGRAEDPFLYENIQYHPAIPARSHDGWKTEGSPAFPPLQLVPVMNDDGKPLSVSVATVRILSLLCREIHRLLSAGIRLEEKQSGEWRPLEAGDIAVLTRKNREAEEVRQSLVRAGIPAVIRTDNSVYQSAEADHMLAFLRAVWEPTRIGLIKTALASPLFGYSAGELDAFDQDENAWQETAGRFSRWREEWARHGFMRMFRSFTIDLNLRAALLGCPDGERMVANFQHLAECLHCAEKRRGLLPASLPRWLNDRKNQPGHGEEDHLIRLEKDEKAVQIVTMHRSKGLEYPVVFLPFGWTHSTRSGPGIVFHDPDEGNRLTWNLGRSPPEAHRLAFEREQLAEGLRLQYVAMTRARHCCYLFHAFTRDSMDPRHSPLGWLLRNPDGSSSSDPASAFQLLTDGRAAGLHTPPPVTGEDHVPHRSHMEEEPRARLFQTPLPADSMITSFSGLTAARSSQEADRDSQIPLPNIVSNSVQNDFSIFTFPHGTRSGNFFHALLETLDFSHPGDLAPRIGELLEAHRIDPRFASAAEAQIRLLCDMTLPHSGRLADIPAANRKTEIPFVFPIRQVSPANLRKTLAGDRIPPEALHNLDRLVFCPADGHLTGFIDMVFHDRERWYLVDWKSNWLGPDSSHYGGPALAAAMASGYYHLQYHLYALALHRWLRLVLPPYRPERHFGGVYYIFLRGLRRDDCSSGVFHAQLPPGRIEKLERLLMRNAPHGRTNK